MILDSLVVTDKALFGIKAGKWGNYTAWLVEDETLAFIIQPNSLCQLFMVDMFHRGSMARICSTNHHCQAGGVGDKTHCTISTALVINIMHNVEYWYNWQLHPPLLLLSPGGFQICCNIMQFPSHVQYFTVHNTSRQSKTNGPNRCKYRSAQWRALQNSRYMDLTRNILLAFVQLLQC